jgi:hypothetical protein
MTYETAFIMVGRVFLWATLVFSVPQFAFWFNESLARDKTRYLTDPSWETVFSGGLLAAAYAAVILCARYVP